MEAVLRVAVVYFVLLLLFRLAGRRTMGDATPFDFVMILIISEFVQAAIVGDDPSLVHAFVLCASIIGLDVALSFLKSRFPSADRWFEMKRIDDGIT